MSDSLRMILGVSIASGTALSFDFSRSLNFSRSFTLSLNFSLPLSVFASSSSGSSLRLIPFGGGVCDLIIKSAISCACFDFADGEENDSVLKFRMRLNVCSTLKMM